MEKITNFNGIEHYYCTECNKIHKRTMRKGNKTICCLPFINCKKYAHKLTSNEKWHRDFSKSWDRNVKFQKKEKLPIGLPKRDKR